MTEARLEEWRKQLRRLSQQKVTQADSQTIINAIRTWKELAHYQEDRGLEVVEDLDLASFVQDGTDGPARAEVAQQSRHDGVEPHQHPASGGAQCEDSEAAAGSSG